MITITKKDRSKQETIIAKTKNKPSKPSARRWWDAPNKSEMTNQLIATSSYLRQKQNLRIRQANVNARLYGGQFLFGGLTTNINRAEGLPNSLPLDRPTMNVVQSVTDTLVSNVIQSKPRPVFLTDNGLSQSRFLTKNINKFITGELYRMEAYDLGEAILRDASVLGTGCVKIFEDQDKKLKLDRTLLTELMVDSEDAMYGSPRQLYQHILVDREVLMSMFPESQQIKCINASSQAFFDDTSQTDSTISDQVMLVEAWRLPSGPESGDGMHAIACEGGLLIDADYDKNYFPFAFLHYSPRLLGFWAQGIAERLMGTQLQINKLLMTISRAINLVGVPRVFVENGSKINKAFFNNEVGSIVPYTGTPPTYQVAPCVPQEMYAQLQRLIQYAYEQEGVSQLAASAQKPAGLDAAVALREYNDQQSARFTALTKRWNKLYTDLAYMIIDKSGDIVERDGKYSTIYPTRNKTEQIDFPKVDFFNNTYLVQCFDSSSLPREPAARLEKITEMMQAGILSPQEGRRLLDYPDIDQNEMLANAAEERILKYLDDIVENGTYEPPDAFMDPQLVTKLVTQYYNLYAGAGLSQDRAQQLSDFQAQMMAITQQAAPPATPGGSAPMANPMPPPTSQLLPNTANQPNVSVQ